MPRPLASLALLAGVTLSADCVDAVVSQVPADATRFVGASSEGFRKPECPPMSFDVAIFKSAVIHVERTRAVRRRRVRAKGGAASISTVCGWKASSTPTTWRSSRSAISRSRLPRCGRTGSGVAPGIRMAVSASARRSLPAAVPWCWLGTELSDVGWRIPS